MHWKTQGKKDNANILKIVWWHQPIYQSKWIKVFLKVSTVFSIFNTLQTLRILIHYNLFSYKLNFLRNILPWIVSYLCILRNYNTGHKWEYCWLYFTTVEEVWRVSLILTAMNCCVVKYSRVKCFGGIKWGHDMTSVARFSSKARCDWL